MSQRETEVEVPATAEVRTLEEGLKVLWDKVRLATDLINGLKQEKQSLVSQVHTLEGVVDSLRSEAMNKEQEIKLLRSELLQSVNSNEDFTFSTEEKEILKERIRGLIAIINSHL